MNTQETRMAPVVAGGLVAGMLADLLLRDTPWGISVTIWSFSFLAGAAWLACRYAPPLPRELYRLALPASFFAATFAWRDSTTLCALNGLALCALFSLAALRRGGAPLAVGRVTEYSLGLLREWLAAPISYLGTTAGVTFSSLRHIRPGAGATPAAVLRGLLITVPPLVIFGFLLTSADASFEHLITSLIQIDLSALYNQLFWLPVCILLAGGMLLRIVVPVERPGHLESGGRFPLGRIEITMLLGMLNLLFFGFIVSQLGYFFGGAAALTNTAGLSAATYARRGFFELVAVSLLVLPLLLTTHWLLHPKEPEVLRLFKVLSASLVIMLYAIMASAMHRMYLYQHSFGLTELRLYTSVFMVWLALVFLWFLRTVLCERRDLFGFGALVCGLALVAVLDLVNPDAVIVRVNTVAPAGGTPIDSCYLTELSCDAVPALIDALPALDSAGRMTVISSLKTRIESIEARDWRAWNWSGIVARDEAKARLAGLVH